MSKKIVFVVALMATLTVTALAGAGLALAQEPTAPAPGYGCCGGWGRGGGWGWHGMGLIDALAELTKLEPADLYAELQGKTLLEVAQARGISAEQLVEAALASRTQVLQQRVEAGYLTQQQADWMLEHMEEEMLEHLEAGVSPVSNPSTSSGHRCWRFGGQSAPNAGPGRWGGWPGGGRWMPGSTL